MPAIRLEALTKCYGSTIGIDGVDLEVPTGGVFGYLGPNGAGKTTTIRILVDLLRPTSGRAFVLGMDARRQGVEIRQRIGYLPGELSLYRNLTGNEVLDYFARLRGGVDHRYRNDLVARYELDPTRRVSQSSTGNKQKIGIVQAFMHRPELLILDEPTTGLDPLLQATTYELIEEVRREGRTVFVSSHFLPEVERVADRVGIIRAGRVVEVESVNVLKERAVRFVEIRFGDPATGRDTLLAIPGVRDATVSGNHATLRIEGSMDPLVKALARFEVLSLRSRESDLEEIFLAMYRGTDD
jgi:ABC-2 type transport system ATP-binding protein